MDTSGLANTGRARAHVCRAPPAGAAPTATLTAAARLQQCRANAHCCAVAPVGAMNLTRPRATAGRERRADCAGRLTKLLGVLQRHGHNCIALPKVTHPAPHWALGSSDPAPQQAPRPTALSDVLLPTPCSLTPARADPPATLRTPPAAGTRQAMRSVVTPKFVAARRLPCPQLRSRPSPAPGGSVHPHWKCRAWVAALLQRRPPADTPTPDDPSLRWLPTPCLAQQCPQDTQTRPRTD